MSPFHAAGLKRLLLAALSCLCAAAGVARLMPNWSYDLLVRKADLIIVATPVTVRDVETRTEYPRFAGVLFDENRARTPSIWIETTFERLAVLKGEDPGPQVSMRHLRWPEVLGLVNDPPQFVRFDPGQKRTYLLFLKREENQWVPLTGQVDPVYSAKDLSEPDGQYDHDDAQALPARRSAP